LTNDIPAGADVWAAGMSGSTVTGRVYPGGYPNDPRAYLFNRYGATALANTTNGVFSMANDINSAGVVVGRAMGPGGRAHAVRWRPIGCLCPPPPASCLELPPCGKESPDDLGLPPGFADTDMEAAAINDLGQIVVNANLQYVAAHYALRWHEGNWQRLQDREWDGAEYAGWTVALGISSLGHIAGYSDGIDWTYFAHAWVFDPHNEPDSPSAELRVTDLHQRYNFDAGGNGYSRATGVNRWGHVVGWRKPSRFTGTARAFVIARDELIDLAIFSESHSGELQVNDSGDIIAYDFSTVAGSYYTPPLVIRDDGLTLCGLGCFRSAEPSYSHHRAFVLSDLVLGGIGPFGEFIHVSAIGELGEIAGTMNAGGWRPFLLVPASAPGNHPPVAVNDTVTRFTDRVMVSASQRLLLNDTDPDPNEVLSLVNYSTGTTNGGTVFQQGDWLTYTPTNGFTGVDHFSYTISDNRGGLASATVTIQPENPRFIPSLGEIATLSEPGTIPAVRFHGEPGKTYRIERRDDLGPLGTWQTVAVLTAGPDGTLDTLDPGTIFRDRRYWRAVQQTP